MADHRKTGMTPVELRDDLGRHVMSVQRILDMFPEQRSPDLSARGQIRSAVTILKAEVSLDHKRGSALSGIEGTAIYQPTIDKVLAILERIRVDTTPDHEWFSALDDVELELTYAMSQIPDS
jgi:hypothetical protein